jgi:peptidoglycan L-alanyl-D-glutamate endopeptidase CwlK
LALLFAEQAEGLNNRSVTVDLSEIISAVQKALGVEVDGTAGPETWNAIYNRICRGKTGPRRKTAVAESVAVRAGARNRVDDRSEKAIATLSPQVQPYARALVKKAAQHGITIKVIAGLRTYEEQNELFAQGRTKPGRIVTNARGGYSNHNFGIAFDVGVFEGANYLDESPKYKAVGALGMDLGLEWGGNWKTFVDEPHFQLRPKWAGDMKESVMLAELRTRKDSGKGAYA